MIYLLRKVKNKVLNLIDSFYAASPKRHSIIHCGVKRKDDIRFKNILLVDDVPQYIQNSLNVITNYYTSGEVKISMAYNYAAALDIFSKEKSDLVVLDLDLQDEQGDGSSLAREFTSMRKDVVILANSKIQKYNNILIANGAVRALGKRKELLRKWLGENEPLP